MFKRFIVRKPSKRVVQKFLVYLEGNPEIHGRGLTAQEALGNLFFSNRDALGIQIEAEGT